MLLRPSQLAELANAAYQEGDYVRAADLYRQAAEATIGLGERRWYWERAEACTLDVRLKAVGNGK